MGILSFVGEYDLTGIFRRLFKHESTKLADSELRHSYIEACKRRIVELEREFADLIQKPYQAGRLSEIISELGSMWNEILRHESINNAVNGNGAKNLWQVQDEVSNIVQEAKQQIAISKESDSKFIVFVEGLLNLRYVLDEWETQL
jgi:hypothetical protein